MPGSGFKPDRLRVNLRLAINRLKLLEKKKTEMALKSRKEIADYLSYRKDERARIRVEHIIREDYLVEAMEILELYCDLLLARFGLISSMKELDPGLAEAVSTLIWAAPRLQAEVSELKTVASQLCRKYSKEYGELCRSNQTGTVNERLMLKLSAQAPPKILVERYLIEIAKNYKVEYEPDSRVMSEAPTGLEVDGSDFKNDRRGGPGNGGAGGGDFSKGNMLYPQVQEQYGDSDVGIYEECTFMYPPPRGNPTVHQNPPPYGLKPLQPDIRVFPAQNNGPESKPRTTQGADNIPDKYDNLPLPKLPSVPVSPAHSAPTNDNSTYEDIDFEDLHKRLDDLKKK